MKKFTILYNNIRGIKSKEQSLKDIIDAKKPTIVCIVETHLKGEEQCYIDGYNVMSLNRNSEGGGIIIAIREEFKNITKIVETEEKDGEMMWIKIDNGKIKIRIGVIYGRQESRTTTRELESFYEKIKKQIQISKVNDDHLMIIGDLNCKIGKEINGNTEEI